MNPLPISVIIPTRNEGQNIEAHIDALGDIVAQAHEVIAVDSESSDGTTEVLDRRISSLPNGRVFRQPRGLYQAWNFGVQNATADYVYFATVGDLPLVGGVDALVGAAQSHSADVVLSPPQMRGDNGDSALRWPVHALTDLIPEGETLLLDAMMKLLLNYAFLPGQGILGSSASNLYRRQFLTDHPFPTDCGHGGDTVWGCRFADPARIVLLAKECAEFRYESRSPGYNAPDQSLIYDAVSQELRRCSDQRRDAAGSVFLAGRRETHNFLLESLRTQSQQFSYIGELKEELEKRFALIETLDSECKRLAGELGSKKSTTCPSILRQIADRLAGR
ncbi:MAG: glycosyltransferase family 2 protein [Chthoniobacterales bacterium]